jgi:sec-independent protein translocase protein TatC
MSPSFRKGHKRPVLKGPEDRMTLRDHLAELRVRIVRCMLAIVVGIIVVMAFYDPILRFLTKPYRDLCTERGPDFCDGRVYGLGPLDGFTTRISISLWGGIILAFPVIMWQIWRFIVPALHAREKKYAIPFIVSTVALFLLGGFIAYWTLQYALEFLISWSGDQTGQVFQIGKYVSLVGLMIAAYGVGFEFPVLLVFLQIAGVLTPRTLVRQWRIALVVIFFIAAVITPSGDPISMLALAIPMTLLYFVAIGVGALVTRGRAHGDDDEPTLAGAAT